MNDKLNFRVYNVHFQRRYERKYVINDMTSLPVGSASCRIAGLIDEDSSQTVHL